MYNICTCMCVLICVCVPSPCHRSGIEVNPAKGAPSVQPFLCCMLSWTLQ